VSRRTVSIPATRNFVLAAASSLAIAGAGCAGLRKSDSVATDVAPQKVERREEVVRQFESARDQAQYQAAANFLRQGNNKACRQSIEQLLGRNPTHHDARLLFADLLIDEQDYDGAEKQLRDLLTAKAEDARAEHTLGLVLDAKGQAEEARGHYARAAKLDPKDETYRLSCQLAAGAVPGGPAPAVAAQSKGGVVQASSRGPIAADSALGAKSAPSSNAVRPSSRRTQPEEGADVSEALYRLEEALSQKDAAAAHAAVEDLAAAAPDNPQIRIKAAVIALRHENADLAAEIATAATLRFPKSAEAFRILGTAHYRLRQYSAAQSALASALTLDGKSALSNFLMGCTLNKLGKAEAAASHFARAAELDPRFAKSAN
jgi:tetratricopeptide (TPR) repeat protein